MQLKKSRVLAALVLGFCLTTLCSAEVASEAVLFQWTKIDDNALSASGKLRSGLHFEKVTLEKRRLDAKWVLELQPQLGSRFEVAGRTPLRLNRLTYLQFLELLSVIFDEVHRRDVDLSHVHVQLGLVDEYRNLAISAVKSSSCRIRVIESKNPCLSRALSVALERSDLTGKVCALVKQQGAQCSRRRVSTDVIAFEDKLVGKPWTEALKSSTGGIKLSELWFSINIDRGAKAGPTPTTGAISSPASAAVT